MADWTAHLGSWLATAFAVAVAALASAHAVLTKRDVRAAIGWIGLILLVPVGGAVLYGLFGINRIRRRASVLRPPRPHPALPGPERLAGETALAAMLPAPARHLVALGRLVDSLSPVPLTFGNAVTLFDNGTAALDAMLTAIDGAERSVGLATYIFDDDRTGRAFADALARAVRRGIAVRVLIDGVGARYSLPPMTRRLERLGVPVAEFLPTFVPLHLAYANLRNHRKILCIDGGRAFTGGMNIRGGYRAGDGGGPSIRDLQVRLEGPVVQHLVQVFADDWAFCTGEALAGDAWQRRPAAVGSVAARGITSGPDEEVERIRWTILGAVSRAERRIRVVTPYFLPDTLLGTALVLAATRGVAVDIVVPAQNNLRLVQWASRAKIGTLIEGGCRVWETPPPFDHAKIMTVDGAWSMIGSANWDERSLRLNFEMNVEVFDGAVAAALDDIVDRRLAAAAALTLNAVRARSLAVRLRDGTAWLLSPYL
jgi:cardiolipin synthase